MNVLGSKLKRFWNESLCLHTFSSLARCKIWDDFSKASDGGGVDFEDFGLGL